MDLWNSCVDQNGVATLQCVPVAIKLVINGAILFAGLTALIFIIFSGYKYITSDGDPKQTENAKKTLTYAIIGLVVVFMAFFIVNLIGSVTNLRCIASFSFTGCK